MTDDQYEEDVQVAYFVARGDVRGDCGHRHRMLEAAERCAERDRRACRALPGGNSYSDRRVVAHYADGTEGPVASDDAVDA